MSCPYSKTQSELTHLNQLLFNCSFNCILIFCKVLMSFIEPPALCSSSSCGSSNIYYTTRHAFLFPTTYARAEFCFVVPGYELRFCSLIHVINMLLTVRFQTPDTAALFFSNPCFYDFQVELNLALFLLWVPDLKTIFLCRFVYSICSVWAIRSRGAWENRDFWFSWTAKIVW